VRVHDNRQLVRLEPELAHERLDPGVLFEVEKAVRKAVAREEHPEPLRVAREARADHSRPCAQPDQERPAREVGTQDQVGEALLVVDQLTQARTGNLQHLPRLDDARGQVNRLTGQQVQLAEKAALAVDSDRLLVRAACVLDDRHLARKDDEEVVARVAIGEQHLSGRDCAPHAVLFEGRDRLVAQPWERTLGVACFLELTRDR
jgi:hypothetical protein